MQILSIDHKSPYLTDIILLGRKNAKTLGMFPDGAFEEHAKKRTIFAAIENDRLSGYLLYRTSKRTQRVSITHLCIDPKYRGNGIGMKLLDTLKAKYAKTFRGIALSCRRDYVEASKLWEHAGFKATDTTRSRSKTENYLIRWWYDFGNTDLFSGAIFASPKVNALLDANIIVKLRDAPCEENKEPLALKADWLEEETEFYFAPELFNEINRDPDHKRADSTRKFAHTLTEARFSPSERDRIIEELMDFLPHLSANHESDRKQLAECIAAGITYFITMDDGLLARNAELYTKFGVSVLRPAEFVLFIDHNVNGLDYRSYRLAGVHFEIQNIKQADLDALCGEKWLFKGEKKYQLRDRLTAVVSDMKNGLLKMLKDHTGACIGFFAMSFVGQEAKITAIRVSNRKIKDILLQQLLREIITSAQQRDCLVVILQDELSDTGDSAVFQSLGFDWLSDRWAKVICTGFHASGAVLQGLTWLKKYWNTEAIAARLKEMNAPDRSAVLLEIERKLAPVKFSDVEVPTYIIPIKSNWAGELFDYYISSQSLFGAKAELSWNRENVYYRSVKPVSEAAPARILWYVSGDHRGAAPRTKSIVATSYLDAVHIGPAKELFKKFKNYGIYEWRDIAKLTGNEASKEIKVLKFVDTEVFESPVSLHRVQEIFKACGKPANTFASPVEVSCQIFNEIYRIGNSVK